MWVAVRSVARDRELSIMTSELHNVFLTQSKKMYWIWNLTGLLGVSEWLNETVKGVIGVVFEVPRPPVEFLAGDH